MNVYKSIKRNFQSLKNRQIFVVLCVILFLLILAACSGTEPVAINVNNDDQISESEPVAVEDISDEQPAETEIPPTQVTVEEMGKIAFWTSRDGNGEIYLMDADGGNLINLTNNDANDGYPLWSPDGSKIAFISDRDSDYENTGTWVSEIYIMNADGSEQTRLTNNDINESFIDWSPDGEKFLFHTNWDGIYHGNEDWNSDYILANKINQLNWAEVEIGVMDLDGSNVVRLTNNDFKDVSPKWSPDGSKIAFSSERDKETQIFVMNADGSEEIQLTFDEWINYFPVWSPDGSEILYTSVRDEEIVMCRMTAEGKYGGCFNNPNYYSKAFVSDWSQDGRWILYRTYGYQGSGIYIMNVDGGEIVSVLEGTVTNRAPVWQP